MLVHAVGLLSLPWAATGPQGWRPERVFSSTPARLYLYPPENCGPFPLPVLARAPGVLLLLLPNPVSTTPPLLPVLISFPYYP